MMSRLGYVVAIMSLGTHLGTALLFYTIGHALVALTILIFAVLGILLTCVAEVEKQGG